MPRWYRIVAPVFAASTMLAAGFAVAQETAADPVAATGPGLIPLIMRWTHIGSAIVMLGGSIFALLVVQPSLAQLDDADARMRIAGAVRTRWRALIPWLIGGFLVSGFYNYLVVTRHAHEGEGLYHMLFGIKFLLSMAVFTLASMLVGRSSLAQRMQAEAPRWSAITIGLAVAVVLVAGYMRLM